MNVKSLLAVLPVAAVLSGAAVPAGAETSTPNSATVSRQLAFSTYPGLGISVCYNRVLRQCVRDHLRGSMSTRDRYRLYRKCQRFARQSCVPGMQKRG